ncbi:MAG: type II secretion system protein [Candidatus Peribacteraceae bacterium]|jgi:prepilin-type N-terminal cleavage/methylation domain-containing protein
MGHLGERTPYKQEYPRGLLRAGKRMKKGFTLVELLLSITIIGFLAYIVITAINPSLHLAKAHDAKRQSDVLTLVNAMNQFIMENNNTLPSTLTDVPQQICSINATSCTYINLSMLVPEYVADLPSDPLANGETVGYTIRKDWRSRIVVEAPLAEIMPSIMAVN